MTTSESYSRLQPLLLAAYAVIGSAIVISVLTFFLSPAPHIFKALYLFSASLFSLGAGELFNHPKQKIITSETVKTGQKAKYHRKRNSCGLGNLLDICGLLLLFIALASFLFPH